MRIAIDLTALVPHATGVDHFLLQLVTNLSRVDTTSEYTVFINAGDRGRLPDLGANFSLVAGSLRGRASRLLFQQFALPAVSYAKRFDVIHSPSFLKPMWRGASRHMLTVHDLTMFSEPLLHTRLRRHPLFLGAVARSIRRAHLIHVPSECTRRDLLQWFPDVRKENVRSIPHGIGERFSPAGPQDIAAQIDRLGIQRPYLLHVGTIEPRKNLAMLVDAFERLTRDGVNDLNLVLAGPPGWSDNGLAAKSSRLRGRIHFTGYLSDDDLVWLYRGAALFVYPSLYEGFGFPPLEAMACGVPVVASRSSAIEENLEGAAELVPPNDVEGLASAVRRVLGDPDHRAGLVERGRVRAASFTWEKTARALAECYRELASRGRETHRGT